VSGGASRDKRSLARSARETHRHVTPSGACALFTNVNGLFTFVNGAVERLADAITRVNCHMTRHPSRVLKHAYVRLQTWCQRKRL
jgi:hypothetical protein